MSAPDTAKRRGYLRHNWSWKAIGSRFVCMRRGCKATHPDWRHPVCRPLKRKVQP